jgi:hypothetical protein
MAGQWKWREEEVSLKSFYQMSKEEKQEHIKVLEKIPEKELSSNDIYILNFYSKKKINFFSIDEYDLQ